MEGYRRWRLSSGMAGSLGRLPGCWPSSRSPSRATSSKQPRAFSQYPEGTQVSAGFLLPHSTLHIHLQSCFFVLSNLRFCLVCCASLQRLLRQIGAADFSASIHGTVNLGRCCEQTGHVQDHSICISLLKSLHDRAPVLLCKCSCCSHLKPYLIRTIQAAQGPSCTSCYQHMPAHGCMHSRDTA